MPWALGERPRMILLGSWYLLHDLWYFVIGGVALAAVLGTWLGRRGLPAFLRSTGVGPVALAAVAGVLSPICTVGTVPIFVQMRRSGAPLAPAVSFLTASSALNPQLMTLVAGALGVGVAAGQFVASVVIAMIVGWAVSRLAARASSPGGEDVRARCTLGHLHRSSGAAKGVLLETVDRFIDLLGYVGCYFLAGVVAASVIRMYVPPTLVMGALGAGKWYAVPLAGLLSVPLYACGGASVPILQAGQQLGAAAGAILAYLVVGPLTRVAAFANMAAVVGRKATAVYAVLVVVLGTAFGYAYALIRAALA